MEVRMSHESRYTLVVRLHDGGDTTGERGVSIRVYGVYDILHTRSLETTAAFAEIQWLTADDVIWKVFFFFILFLLLQFHRALFKCISVKFQEGAEKRIEEKSSVMQKFLNYSLTWMRLISYYTAFKPIGSKHFTTWWRAVIRRTYSNHMTYSILYNIHILISLIFLQILHRLLL